MRFRQLVRACVLASAVSLTACSTGSPVEPAAVTADTYRLSAVWLGSQWVPIGAGLSCPDIPALGCTAVTVLGGTLVLDEPGGWALTLRLASSGGEVFERVTRGSWSSFGNPTRPSIQFSGNGSGILVLDRFGFPRALVEPGVLSGEATPARPTTSITLAAVTRTSQLSLRFTR